VGKRKGRKPKESLRKGGTIQKRGGGRQKRRGREVRAIKVESVDILSREKRQGGWKEGLDK